jgi:Uncharacterised protein family (UPF0158)
VLDPDAVDLDALCAALDDRSPETTWYIHAGDGRIVPSVDESLSGVAETEDFDDPVWHAAESVGSGAGYRDMAEFVAGVHHRRAAELLDRAISGRGAFRRFKDTLVEFPELRDAWFRFRDARARRRALAWLADEGLVDPQAARRAMAAHPDPVADDEDVPAALAVDLQMHYGDRLEQVLLCGAGAREPGEYDVELLVVLRDLRDPWHELEALDELLWRHAERSGLTVVALPVDPKALAAAETAALRRAAAEAVRVA